MNGLSGNSTETQEGHRRFRNFLNGFAMLPSQLEVARDKGCLIEVLVIQTAFVDALLRMALVLKEQLVDGHGEIDFDYLYQPDNERNFSERQVYQMALDKGVIDMNQFDSLVKAYAHRNRVIHRLFISEIKYSNLVPVIKELDLGILDCLTIVSELEQEQMRTGIGMTKPSRGKKFTEQDAVDMMKQKL